MLAGLVDDMLPVGFDLTAKHIRPGVMVVGLGKRRVNNGDHANEGDNGSQKTICTNHGYTSGSGFGTTLPVLQMVDVSAAYIAQRPWAATISLFKPVAYVRSQPFWASGERF